MILVYFRGYGEWFIRGSDGEKLAIPRTTNIRYQENNQPRQIEQAIFLSYEEWRGDLDDSDELFSEWAHDYERQKKIQEIGGNDYSLYGDDCAKPGEYDYQLDGIFYRDKDAKGDVFDTNGLKTGGVDYIKCRETDGVFMLIEKDENYFRLTNIDQKTDWSEFSKIVKKLIPCEHPESAFFKEVKSGRLPPEHEQKEICLRICAAIDAISRQVFSINKVTDRLQEYRSALITNAVTGKIDVREWCE